MGRDRRQKRLHPLFKLQGSLWSTQSISALIGRSQILTRP